MRVQDLDGHASHGFTGFVEQIDLVLSGLLLCGDGDESEGSAVLWKEADGAVAHTCGYGSARTAYTEGIALPDGSRQVDDLCAGGAHKDCPDPSHSHRIPVTHGLGIV